MNAIANEVSEPLAPFGSWKSPITSELIVSTTIGIGAVAVDGEDLYWLEIRPTEKGRNVLVRRTVDGKVEDVTPAPFNVRTRVHEYGGGAFLVSGGTVYFSNFADGRIYYSTPGSLPEPLTAESNRRYADFILDREGLTSPFEGEACTPRQRNRLICVCEDHSNSSHEPENTIVTVDLATGEVATLISGSDFYSSPRLSPDGTKLAWLSWNHPYLPWDSTYLWIATLNSEGIGEAKLVAGNEQESICEPKWSKDGELYFSSDRNDWWNLYRYSNDGTVEPVWEMDAEFAYPHWVFGLSTYDFIDRDRIICTYSQNGSWHLGKINTKTKQFSKITTSYTNISSIQATANVEVVFIAGSPTEPTAAVKFNPKTETTEIIKTTGELEFDPGYLSEPEAIAFPTENGLTAYAWYYPPKNKDYSPLEGELPPLMVKSHGGPTAAASVSLSLRIQYWTTRGFGYLDVNYGGSIGYGRQYRQRLTKNWGIVDIDDCVNAAKYLVQQGRVDRERLVISGSSAGGYTTLAALTFRDTFKAGGSYYGVSDLEILAKDTHKFESRYLDGLIGAYPAEKDLYVERSPIHFTEKLATPVIFFQGLQDKVVPPNQAEMMFTAIKNKGLPVAYVTFEEEAHGFRQADNIKKALDSEFYFYSRVFGFEPADAIEPITIFNLIEDS
jgi:dipeptidyl aminopeptidase/acylaminoacyl peptidase